MSDTFSQPSQPVQHPMPADQPPRRGWRYWLQFVLLVNLARLRFILLLILIGVVIIYWDVLVGYYRKWTRPSPAVADTAAEQEWFCPMHPNVVRDQPGECPICHMPLARRKKSLHLPEPLPPGVLSRVQLSPYRVILAGIRTWPVTYIRLNKTITTLGYVEFDERALRQIAARVKGRLDKLYINQTGQMVHAGDDLALLYSPELIVTSQNLLEAKRSGNQFLYQTAFERLRLWGIDEDQIAAILRQDQPITHLKIRSPIEGHVITRYVREGQYVEEGAPIYDVADLSTVWIEGQVYETDLVYLPPQEVFHRQEKARQLALPVVATTQATGEERFAGLLTFIHPHLDWNTRTIRVRYEISNPQHKLRPGTSARVELNILPRQIPLLQQHVAVRNALILAVSNLLDSMVPAAPLPAPTTLPSTIWAAGNLTLLHHGYLLAVPELAVIDTGRQKIVYRQIGPGLYEAVLVQLGPRMEDEQGVGYYPVLAGLEADDLIVTAGSFLLDAETRLNPAAASLYFGAAGLQHRHHQQESVHVSSAHDEEAGIRANLAKLPRQADRELAARQRYCPIQQQNRLGSMGPPVKIILDGEPVFLCCSGCVEEARKHPQQTVATVRKLRQQEQRSRP
jgi:Cu(I)/Ag(I) efflux system membrane fusion protein